MYFDLKKLTAIKPYFFGNDKYGSDFSMKTHTHKTIELMYCDNGLFKVEYSADSSFSEETVTEGQFVLVKPNIPHKISVPTAMPAQIISIEFGSQDPDRTVEELFFENPLVSKVPESKWLYARFTGVILFNDSQKLIQTLRKLQNVIVADNYFDTNELEYSFLLGCFFIEFMRCVPQQKKIQSNLVVKKALNYIQKDFALALSVADVARFASVSPTYLERLFHEQFGMSVYKKINEIRIEEAKKLLKNSNLPIMQIHSAVGFKSHQAFLTNFYKSARMTPGNYRRTSLPVYLTFNE